MFGGKNTSASHDFIMAMGKKAGNLKEPRKGGSSHHTHDKKSKMGKEAKGAPPMAKKKKVATRPLVREESSRDAVGALGIIK